MRDIFDIFKKSFEDEKYFIESQERTLVYSKKSLMREQNIFNKRISEAKGEGRILFYIAPFHEEITKDVKNIHEKIIWFSPVNFSINHRLSDKLFLIDNAEKWDYFINEIKHDEKYKIIFHPVLLKLKEYDVIKEAIEKAFQKAAVRIKTINYFQKTWEHNYKKNKKRINILRPVGPELKNPDFFILGGPSVDVWIKNFQQDTGKIIWCADTALGTLLAHEIHPHAVFSIDAGYGSYEHFILSPEVKVEYFLIVDMLSFPKVLSLQDNILSYASSNPMVQGSTDKMPEIVNQTGDVFGCMKAVFENLYFDEPLPEIIGKDGKAVSSVTHLRGSAYHRRYGYLQNRCNSIENLFFVFSRQYGQKKNSLDKS